MRLHDIVQTATALRAFQAMQARVAPGAGVEDGQRKVAPVAPGEAAGMDPWQRGDDSLELSPAALSAGQMDGTADEMIYGGDDDAPLAAIIESFVRQRSVMQIGLPIATAAGAGFFNLTLEVEETYRVIEFVPGQRTDRTA
ncbi:MAG: hypothetical protein MUE97_03080 [Phycisphaerales bacterium]|jgi:hypothetical protein|nr:hypothetical protein [Phycisphaerales bacterium]